MAELYDVFFDDDLKAAYPDKADVVLDVIRKLPSAQADGDTISRQAAITAIQKAYADTEGGTDKCAVWKNVGLTNALHIMQDLPPAQPEPQWIPCSERLPEESGRYLISVLDGIGRRTTVAPYQPRYKAWTMTGRMAYWKVVAWMPLPEPYGEKER